MLITGLPPGLRDMKCRMHSGEGGLFSYKYLRHRDIITIILFLARLSTDEIHGSGKGLKNNNNKERKKKLMKSEKITIFKQSSI